MMMGVRLGPDALHQHSTPSCPTSRCFLNAGSAHAHSRLLLPRRARAAACFSGGASMEPPKHGGGWVGKRGQLTGPFISYYELWRQRRQKNFEH